MGSGSLMIHGMVAYDRCIFLSVIKERITGRVYVEHLKKTFATLKERYRQYIFQQDNAPAHTCKLVNEFFVKEDITSLKWPAKSRDFNMENIWHMLSEKVYSGRKFNNKNDLTTSILDAKEYLIQHKKETIRGLFDNFKTRVTKVITNDGRLIN